MEMKFLTGAVGSSDDFAEDKTAPLKVAPYTAKLMPEDRWAKFKWAEGAELAREAAHGIWEMAVKREHLPDFPSEVITAIVENIYNKDYDVAWMSCASAWSACVYMYTSRSTPGGGLRTNAIISSNSRN